MLASIALVLTVDIGGSPSYCTGAIIVGTMGGVVGGVALIIIVAMAIIIHSY